MEATWRILGRRLHSHGVTIGLILVLLGLAAQRRAFDAFGHDLGQLYVAAKLLSESQNVYDFTLQREGYLRYVGEVTTWGHFYTPGTSVAMLPIVLLPYGFAREVWLYGGIAVLAFGLWRFMLVFLPQWDRPRRVLVIGLVMCSSVVRWGCFAGQPAALVGGLFALFLVELRSPNRLWVLVLLGAYAGAIKVTLGLPFLLLALAQRRLVLAGAFCATWAAANLVGIAGHGGPHVLDEYRANMALFEGQSTLNYPDPRGPQSGARTDWPYLLNALRPDIALNYLLGGLLTLGTLTWLAAGLQRVEQAWLRSEAGTLALLGPITALSLLSVYHHPYDMTILLVVLLAYSGRREFEQSRARTWYLVVVGLHLGVYQEQNLTQLAVSLFGTNALLVSRPLACAVCVVGLVSSGIVLQRLLRRVSPLTQSLAPVASATP